jgi:hypothetical protein
LADSSVPKTQESLLNEARKTPIYLGVKPSGLWPGGGTYRVSLGFGISSRWEGMVDGAYWEKRTYEAGTGERTQLGFVGIGRNYYSRPWLRGFFGGLWFNWGLIETQFWYQSIGIRTQATLVAMGFRCGYRFVFKSGEFLSIGIGPGVWLAQNEAKLEGRKLQTTYKNIGDFGLDDIVYLGLRF